MESEERALTAEEHQTWNELTAELERINKQIEVIEQMEEIRSTINEPVLDAKGRKIGEIGEKELEKRALIDKWMRVGNKGLTQEERTVLRPSKSHDIAGGDAIELRASEGNIVNPTYVQTTDVMGYIEQAKRYYGGWMGACDEFRTERGNAMNFPTVDETGIKGAQEAAGTDAFASSTDITLGYKTMGAYYYSSQGVSISNDTLQDADFDLNKWVGEILGERLWRAISTALTTYNGSSKPQGIAGPGGASVGVNMSKCAVTRARLLQLKRKVNYAYRLSPKCGWMMHSDMLDEIAQIVDGDSRPLWQPSMAVGVPDKIEGYPYWLNNDMASNTAYPVGTDLNYRHVLYGDFSKFKIRYAGPTMLVRLVERYAELLETGFIAIQRIDSELIAANASTYHPIKYLRKYGS